MTTMLHIDDARVICACQRRAHATTPTLSRVAAHARRVIPVTLSLCLGISSLGFATKSTSIVPDKAATESPVAAEPVSVGPPAGLHVPDFTVTQEELEAARRIYFFEHVPFGAMIYREARRNGVEPELVAAIVRAESNFRPVAVSGRSATGLMQLVPSTGLEHGTSDLTDPLGNIEAGTKYLRRLQDQYEGNLSLTLAAYNAGEGAVRKYDGVPPYRETQRYVLRVAGYRRAFRQAVAHHAVYGRAPEDHPAQR